MSDLLEELEHYARKVMPHYPNDLCSRAKTDIERLRAQLATSEERLEDVWKHGLQLEAKLASARKALEEARRFCDEELGPSRGSLLYKIANIIDAALTDE